MTDFKVELRHYCRNLRCRSKLRAPVANPREAFCVRGCHTSFYLHRCLVCERPVEERRKVCKRAKCKSALKARFGLGKYHSPQSGFKAQEVPDSIGAKEAAKLDVAWRIVAGPELTPMQLHCATVGGKEAVERINGTNLKHWRLANAKAEERCLVKRHETRIVHCLRFVPNFFAMLAERDSGERNLASIHPRLGDVFGFIAGSEGVEYRR
jgi:hypothetical protein